MHHLNEKPNLKKVKGELLRRTVNVSVKRMYFSLQDVLTSFADIIIFITSIFTVNFAITSEEVGNAMTTRACKSIEWANTF